MNLTRYQEGSHDSVKAHAYSIQGTRAYQQDYASILEEEDCILAVLCDGMGGMNGGEQASAMAAERMIQDFKERNPKRELRDFLSGEAARLDQDVYGLRDAFGRRLEAGTTLAAAVLQHNLFYWLSVGDSRIFMIRERKIYSMAREHNYRLTLREDLQRGKISREEFIREEKTRKADALTSFIGIGKIRLMDISQKPVELIPGDRILLCSDGVTKSLTDDQIQFLVSDNGFDVEIGAERLVDTAMEYSRGSQDNTTAILLAYD